jgi:hypothetical protein
MDKSYTNFTLFIDKAKKHIYFYFLFFLFMLRGENFNVVFVCFLILFLIVTIIYTIVSERNFLISYSLTDNNILVLKSIDFPIKEAKEDRIEINRIEIFTIIKDYDFSNFYRLRIRYFDNKDFVYDEIYRIEEFDDLIEVINIIKNNRQKVEK